MNKPELNINSIVEFLSKEMSWNGCNMRTLDPTKRRDPKKPQYMSDPEIVESYHNISPKEWKAGIYYSCLPGSSVIKELKEAIKKFDKSLKPKIKRDECKSPRDFSHGYIIIFK